MNQQNMNSDMKGPILMVDKPKTTEVLMPGMPGVISACNEIFQKAAPSERNAVSVERVAREETGIAFRWSGDMTDDCFCESVLGFTAHCECLGEIKCQDADRKDNWKAENWFVGVYRNYTPPAKNEDFLFHSGAYGGMITSGEMARAIAEAILARCVSQIPVVDSQRVERVFQEKKSERATFEALKRYAFAFNAARQYIEVSGGAQGIGGSLGRAFAEYEKHLAEVDSHAWEASLLLKEAP